MVEVRRPYFCQIHEPLTIYPRKIVPECIKHWITCISLHIYTQEPQHIHNHYLLTIMELHKLTLFNNKLGNMQTSCKQDHRTGQTDRSLSSLSKTQPKITKVKHCVVRSHKNISKNPASNVGFSMREMKLKGERK